MSYKKLINEIKDDEEALAIIGKISLTQLVGKVQNTKDMAFAIEALIKYLLMKKPNLKQSFESNTNFKVIMQRLNSIESDLEDEKKAQKPTAQEK